MNFISDNSVGVAPEIAGVVGALTADGGGGL